MKTHRKVEQIFVRQSIAALAIAGALFFGLSTQALAAFACVSSNAELQQALNDASDAADDDIRLQTGNFQFPPQYVAFRGNLQLSGGWNSGCSLNLPLKNFSQINAQASNQSFRLRVDNGGISVSRLIFSNFADVSLEQGNESVSSGELALARTRIVGGRVIIVTKSLSVRVQNSVFSGHSLSGLQISNSTATGAQPNVLVQLNTIVHPALPSAIGLGVNSITPFGKVEIFNNVINGHNTDISLLGQEMTLAFNHFNTISLLNGASLSPSSARNLSGNPGLKSLAPFAPIEPNAAVINSGRSIGLPNRDFLGGVRLVGTRPDMGAIESSVNNSGEIAIANAE